MEEVYDAIKATPNRAFYNGYNKMVVSYNIWGVIEPRLIQGKFKGFEVKYGSALLPGSVYISNYFIGLDDPYGIKNDLPSNNSSS